MPSTDPLKQRPQIEMQAVKSVIQTSMLKALGLNGGFLQSHLV